MEPNIQNAIWIKDYQIRIKYDNGSEGDLDLEKELFGPVFEPLRDLHLFRQFKVDPEFQTLVWPNGADLAPEFIREKIKLPA